MIDVIHNPVAGPKVVKRIDRVRAYLSARGLPFRIRETAAPGDAVVMAREAALAGADVVVAVGGDGTMNEVADGLAGSATRLAFVPHGTGNVFAREFSLPGSVEGCLDLLSSGKTISVRMAKANDRRFVLLASAGFDAEVVERMNSRQKNLLGIAAYVLSGARHLLRSQPTLWLEFPDRERIEAQAVIVARGKKYGGNVTIAPGGDITGETFHVIALLRKGRWSIAKFALDALRGKHVASRHVLIRESPSLFVRCPIPSACQVDGEYLGPLPVRFTVTDALLQVVVPAGFPPPAVPAMKNSKVCNVLFLCTGNSARSILAEALVGRLGEGRFRGYSAGSHPKGAVHPLALELLLSLGYPTEGYRSKGWEEFSRPGAPELDFVFTVCDDAAGETCPVWPGSPVTAHWGVPDPAAAEGDELTRRNAFRSTYRELENRIRLFCEGVSVPRNPL